MDVLLKVCGSGLMFGVLCVDGNVIGVRENVCVWLGGEGDVVHV